MKPPRLGPGTTLILTSESAGGGILRRWLDRAGHTVSKCDSHEDAAGQLEQLDPDLLVLDLDVPSPSSLEWLSRIALRYPRLAVLVVTESSALESAVAAMQAGAYDYLVKPVDEVRLITAARNALAFRTLSTRVTSLEREAKGEGFSGIIGRSKPMRDLYVQLDRIAGSDVTVLIHGESGVGKELVARAIHDHSSRQNEPFVAVNCAAIPETLQESELFGHEKGAFTGATDRRVGRFEQANGGTLLFDEVGELSAALQAKLLRVLQERRFSRVGSGGEIEVDVRVLCATHRNLADEVSAGRFREDLFYRLAVVELDVPALREREGDIPLLAQAFLDAYDQSRGETGQNRSLDIPVLQTFLSYPWPGNVRELQNAVQRAAVLSQGSVLKLEDLPKRLREFAAAHGPQDGWPGSEQPVGDFSGARTDADVELTRSAERPRSAPHPTGEQAPPGAGSWDRAPAAQPPRDPVLRPFLPAGMTLEEIEELAVREAFRRARGNVSATARELDISRSVLYRKLDRFQIRDADG